MCLDKKILFGGVLSIIFFTSSSLKEVSKRPNVILIAVDDMGFSDLGCTGNPIIKTPNLDNLAANGLLYTQFYNGARSCPSRASFLTGLYAHQTGLGNMEPDQNQEGYRGDLNNHCVTIAEVLNASGYATFAVGKWHVTRFDEGNKIHNWPVQRGFEKFYGTINGAGSYYDPVGLCRQNELISPYNDSLYVSEDYYYTDAIGDNAVLYLNDYKESDDVRPFFMYVSFTAPHWPLQAPEKYIEPYYGKFDIGWDSLASMKMALLKEKQIFSEDFRPSLRNEFIKPWSDEINKDWESRNMEVYAAMITSMDDNVGKIVSWLKKNKKFDNTVIMFLSDNGACAEGFGRPLKGGKVKLPSNKEYKIVDKNAIIGQALGIWSCIWPYQTRNGSPIYHGVGVKAGADTTYIAIGGAWANCSNFPFRYYKHYIHEGGISTPFIVSWPNGIRKNGLIKKQVAHNIDIMSTIVDITNSKYPLERNGEKVYPMEGHSLAKSFNSDVIIPRTLFWEHGGSSAGVRDGDWKLVRKSSNSQWENKAPFPEWELYNIQEDRAENIDLSESFPEKVSILSKKWEIWAERCKVKPYPKQ